VSFNTFGRVLRFSTWGESHGPAIGAVVDGCPPGLSLNERDIQPFLDKRRPGTSKFTTQRQEPDQVRILSGVFEGKTTGTPISLMIENVDQRSKDYGDVAKAYRPGHADYAYDAKYGFRDYRGGGRSSARETASRVAAGAVARLVIPEVSILAYVSAIGGDAIDMDHFDADEIGKNPFFCPTAGQPHAGKNPSMPRARMAPRSARWSNASPPAFPRAGARRSTPSSTAELPVP
jgi:chorismate synthase